MTLHLTRALPGALMVLPLSLIACTGPPQRADLTPLQSHMYAHFDQADAVHHNLMNGNLEAAKKSADWIAVHPEIHDLPAGTPRYDGAVREFARRITESTDIHEAAVAAALMGSSCGDCHRGQRVEPQFLMGTAVPAGDGPKAEMARHVWAADRMWVGLLGPSDAAWLEGARGFQGGWLDTQEVLVDPGSRDEIREMTRHIYELAAQAETAADRGERAELYGEFLATCADCHRLTMVQVASR